MINVDTAQGLLKNPGFKLEGASNEAKRALDEARGSQRMNGDRASSRLFDRLQIVDDEKHFTYVAWRIVLTDTIAHTVLI
jgi:hypothetical protein